MKKLSKTKLILFAAFFVILALVYYFSSDFLDVKADLILNKLLKVHSHAVDDDYTLLITVVFSFFIIKGFRSVRSNLLLASLLSVPYLVYCIHKHLNGIYAAPVTPICIMFSSVVLKYFYHTFTSNEALEVIKNAMGKYLSEEIIKNVITNDKSLEPGGTRAIVTILFVDIRNFTSISEELAPQDVSSVLNEYFSVIEPVIVKYNGYINKYLGDGLLAIFGKPSDNPNHPTDAVKCADEILKRVDVLRERFKSEGKPAIQAGVGINTGEVFCGNIGTKERLEYTVIGDNVNLAYRIESLNHLIKTKFLISEYTYEYVKDSVEVVKLSDVEIKGKSRPVDIYEILRIKNDEKRLH